MMGPPPAYGGKSENEVPAHRVKIGRPFAVGVYEVTHEEFSYFIAETGHDTGDRCWYWDYDHLGYRARQGTGWRDPGHPRVRQAGVELDLRGHPAVCVSWNDAQAYLSWLNSWIGRGYRLLSESEWEYVARAGAGTPERLSERERHLERILASARRRRVERERSRMYPFSQGSVSSDWGFWDVTVPVGSFEPANAFGVSDVHGNAWEWVEDCWNDTYRGAPADGSAWVTGDCSDRVARGGAWYLAGGFVGAAVRGIFEARSRYDSVGFRVARTLTLE